MFEHFTEHAQRVLELDSLEAQRMHHAYLGTEHLLLGLIREKDGHGHRAMENLGLCLKAVREAVTNLVSDGPDTAFPESFCPTTHFKHVMEMAVEQARDLKHSHVGTEHLLLALLHEPEGVAMKTLERLDVKAEDLRNEILRILEDDQQAA